MTQQLKTMRHELLRGDWPFHQQLLQSRDVEGDVGANAEVPGEAKQRELPITVMANARRVQESLRLMEELAKVPQTGLELDSEKYKQARFSLYSIEQKLLSRFQRRDKTRHISGVYAIIDTEWLKGRCHIDVASQAIRAGARTIHLWDKVTSKKELLPIAREMRRLCSENDVLFIVNGYLDLALAADADGLHLEPDSLPVKVARKLLPMYKILGASAATVQQATAAEVDGADYIVVDGEQLRQVRQTVTVPLVVTAGITLDNLSEVVAAGADSVAVTSAILLAENGEQTIRQIAEQFCAQK